MAACDREEKARAALDIDEIEKIGKAKEALEREINAEKEILERSTSFKYVSLNKKNKEANFQKDLVVSECVYLIVYWRYKNDEMMCLCVCRRESRNANRSRSMQCWDQHLRLMILSCAEKLLDTISGRQVN